MRGREWGGRNNPFPPLRGRLEAVFRFPLPSALFGFTVTHDVDMSVPIKASLMFGLTAGRVGSYTAMNGFMPDFKKIRIVGAIAQLRLSSF